MAFVICSMAIAIVVLSESISVLRDNSAAAYSVVWVIVVMGINWQVMLFDVNVAMFEIGDSIN